MIVYAIVTHLHLVPFRNSLWLFNIASVVAFYSVLMTFFGVNYFLSGMHSYGQNDHVGGMFVYPLLSDTFGRADWIYLFREKAETE